MKLTRFVVDESPRKVLRFTERSGSRCPFWLARPPSERFCSDRGRISGHYTSKGELEIEAWLCWRRPSARIPLHSPRIRLFLSHPTLSSQATSGAGVFCRRGGRRSYDGRAPQLTKKRLLNARCSLGNRTIRRDSGRAHFSLLVDS
jgi:hypothetical protein